MTLTRQKSPGHCPLPLPPIVLRTVSGGGELVFLTVYSTYTYAEGRPQAPVADLRFELAEYHPGDNYGGAGAIVQSGPLSSLNRSGSLQFHDMAAECTGFAWMRKRGVVSISEIHPVRRPGNS